MKGLSNSYFKFGRRPIYYKSIFCQRVYSLKNNKLGMGSYMIPVGGAGALAGMGLFAN